MIDRIGGIESAFVSYEADAGSSAKRLDGLAESIEDIDDRLVKMREQERTREYFD